MSLTARIAAALLIAFSIVAANSSRPAMPAQQVAEPAPSVVRTSDLALPAAQATGPTLPAPLATGPTLRRRTHYISPRGNDINPGTYTLPLRTIQMGINKAHPGDTVMPLAGTYGEHITFPRSGIENAPIIVRGEVGGNGDPLALIDGCGEVTGGWTAAPERGGAIYKRAFKPLLMRWNGGQILRVSDQAMAGDSTQWWDKGFNVLNYAADKPHYYYHLGDILYTTQWWDDVKAVYGVLGDTCFIRFQNGDDPNTCNLWASEDSSAAFDLSSVSYIIIEHLKIQGCQTGVLLSASDHCVIQHNVIRNGNSRVSITGRIFSMEDYSGNSIRHNDLSLGYGSYGHFGEWSGNNYHIEPTEDAAHALNLYECGKWLQGAGATFSNDISLSGSGTNNQIYSNYIHDGGVGIGMWRSSRTHVYDNEFSHFSSIDIYLDLDVESLYVHDNLMRHSNLAIRFGSMGATDDTLRSGYIYLNRTHNDPGVGSVYQFHEGGDDTMRAPAFWCYHNSHASGNDFGSPVTGLCRRMLFVNNIFSGGAMDIGNAPENDTNPNVFLGFDCNFCGGIYRGYRYLAWMFNDRNNQWSADTMAGDINHQVWSLGSEPDWAVPGTSTAYCSGLDLSDTFTIRGVTYGPLPGMTPGYFPGAKPNLGAVQNTSPAGTPQHDPWQGSVTQRPELAFTPNPATGGCVVSRCVIPTGEVGLLTLRDVLGRRVKSISPVPPGIARLDLQGLPPGVYMATLEAGTQSLTRKLVVTSR